MQYQKDCNVELVSRVRAHGDARIYDRRITRNPELEFEVKNKLRNIRCHGVRRVKSGCKDSCRFVAILSFDSCPEIRSWTCDGEERFKVETRLCGEIECPEPVKKHCAPRRKRKCKCGKH